MEKSALEDQEKFRLLFLKFYPKVKAFITYFVKSEITAEDLSQDIFEQLWEKRDFLPEIKFLNAYVFRMAKNAAINYLKSQKVKDDFVTSYVASSDYSIEEDVYAKELELLIRLTIEKMPEQRRKIFEMSRYKNLKNAEIAEKLGISKKTVENHLNIALKQIRRAILLLSFFFQ